MGNELTDIIKKNRDEFHSTQAINEKKQMDHKKKLLEHTELHNKKQEAIGELK